MNKWIGTTHPALHKMMANTVLNSWCCNNYQTGHWVFSPGIVHVYSLLMRNLSDQQDHDNSVNGMLVKAQRNAAR